MKAIQAAYSSLICFVGCAASAQGLCYSRSQFDFLVALGLGEFSPFIIFLNSFCLLQLIFHSLSLSIICPATFSVKEEATSMEFVKSKRNKGVEEKKRKHYFYENYSSIRFLSYQAILVASVADLCDIETIEVSSGR
ncbi:hypothetical protein MCOR27_005653 [Pyricularia oryzae]|uniref:Uncharacterized protein n=1 Tax=Pyricularia grisea TaxID=148305 RepID=A0ABQ8NYI7_PYRGI|nr:hypothetical protein MCOR01_008655 [Pyricularia oryzae]KAI6303946.1 hypothetical protein MCOR33_000929 [Pyricularia grisea]KAH9439308.1 hypothetical protein MCOR02_002871 [Pyricularia oryzae]KAI6260841.1 hypothetical protein MCOR19_002824 [Pyricularia oryzae]KAI6275123.1 hypothetical protein MCOR26_006181 [Pyricularia oryzae]